MQAPSIWPLGQWLTDQHLQIPHYQRPYKWGRVQVQQLLQDIEVQVAAMQSAESASSYRMGTVVVHVEQPKAGAASQITIHNIVDGQQRTVTLLLVLRALRSLLLQRQPVLDDAQDQAVLKKLEDLKFFDPQLTHLQSQMQVVENFQTIQHHLQQAQWGTEHATFLLHRCEVVRVCLQSLTEAFQFFDAQNGRGKALRVHDLLKAYHLRAFSMDEQAQQVVAVQAWEECPSEQLEHLFARFLFQTRQRSRGREAEFFGRRHVGVFKGISLDAAQSLPYARTWVLLEAMLKQGSTVLPDNAPLSWPCQLDAPVINGLRFFNWVAHYRRMNFHLPQRKGQMPCWTERLQQPLQGQARAILITLGDYDGRNRKGDRHVRLVFDALLMYYLDKFGEQGLERAVVLAFVWAYARLMHRAVKVGSMDKFIAESAVNPFALLRDALTPQEFLRLPLPTVSYQGGTAPVKYLEPLQALMERLGYWGQQQKGEHVQGS